LLMRPRTPRFATGRLHILVILRISELLEIMVDQTYQLCVWKKNCSLEAWPLLPKNA
jgi:hypothetical protein